MSDMPQHFKRTPEQQGAPYYEDEWATLFCGDAAEIIPTLDLTPDLLVTDPPYGVAYQSNRRVATDQFALIEGDEDLEVAEAVLALTLPKVRRGRHLYVFGPVEDILRRLPVAAVTELVWDKQIRGMGNLSLPWGVSHEPIFFGVYELSKANRVKGSGNLAARLRKNSVLRYQRIQSDASHRHPTEKPVPLLRDLIESSSIAGEIVFDPFAGSGSTLVAATLEGRRSVGIEIEERYCEVAAKRLMAAARLVEGMVAA